MIIEEKLKQIGKGDYYLHFIIGFYYTIQVPYYKITYLYVYI